MNQRTQYKTKIILTITNAWGLSEISQPKKKVVKFLIGQERVIINN